MITLCPIPRALVPADSRAAARISAPNYDEFQSDEEVREVLRRRPDAVLRVTMAHCDGAPGEDIGGADSEGSLARAAANMAGLRASADVEERADLLFVYEIAGPPRPGVRQIGLGGFARTDEIRTDRAPAGSIIRNEGIREAKARGRARLIEATGAIIGMVNNAVPDEGGRLVTELEAYADERPPHLSCEAEDGFVHRVWYVDTGPERRRLIDLLAHEPEAYVADGNHRSAAAAMLGRRHFLAVFFPMGRMGIRPYNRLVSGVDPGALADDRLAGAFTVFRTPGGGPVQPGPESEPGGAAGPLGASRAAPPIGLYTRSGGWRTIIPAGPPEEPGDAASGVAHAVAQRLLFGGVLGIGDERDERIRYVGGNRDAAWLAAEVDAGRASVAVTLPPVTMEEFAAVCREGGMMPPKSTWFVPKVRSGLVMALIGRPERAPYA